MIGGGFYALLGKVAGHAGAAAPIAFVCAGVIALLSAFAFAELSARFPFSAGEAHYVGQAFGPRRAETIGLLVVLTGVVSAATLAVAIVGFLQDLVPLPSEALAIFVVVLLMAGIAAWGVGESVVVVAVITIVEVAALLAVLWIGRDSFTELPSRLGELRPSSALGWSGVATAGFLAFYAFVGFEDMVNMAEEVKRPERNLPIAILASVIATTLIYVLVSTVAVLRVAPETLAESKTPIATIIGDDGGWFGRSGIGIVSVLTGVNGALVQIVMAARVGYGLAQRGQLPAWLGRVHPKRQTPLAATAVVTLIVLLLALLLPIESLARATSAIILVVFASVNLALWRIRGRLAREPEQAASADGYSGPCFPRWLSLLGFGGSCAMLLFELWRLLG